MSIYFRELVFADTAERANKIIGKIFKGSAGSNTVCGIAYFGVIYPVTYIAYIFIHSRNYFVV